MICCPIELIRWKDLMSSEGHLDWLGQILDGRYHVTGNLGSGGMGAVLKASDTRLDTDVVIKVPHPLMMKEAEFAARFRREIQSLVKLSHPNIVKVMDVGEHDELPFAVMQFLPGGSLEDLSRLSTLSEVAGWLPDIAAALDFVHSQGLVHRDIKPGNILFDSSRRAYLGDFGIAKVLAEGEGAAEKLTGTGTLIGTAEYMAPEMLVPAAFQEAYNERVDQYSLGVTVYEMLAGRPPFRGDSMAEVAILLATKKAALLHDRVTGLSQAVSKVVARALRKKPERRYENCQAFADSFVAVVRGESVTESTRLVSGRRQSGSPSSARRRVTRAERPGSTSPPAIPKAVPASSRQQTMLEPTKKQFGQPVFSETESDRGDTSRAGGRPVHVPGRGATASRVSPPSQPVEKDTWDMIKKWSSSFGMISFVTSLATPVLLVFLAIMVGALADPDSESQGLHALIAVAVLGLFLMELVACALGIAGLCQARQKQGKVFSILGVIFAACGIVFFTCLGLTSL